MLEVLQQTLEYTERVYDVLEERNSLSEDSRKQYEALQYKITNEVIKLLKKKQRKRTLKNFEEISTENSYEDEQFYTRKYNFRNKPRTHVKEDITTDDEIAEHEDKQDERIEIEVPSCIPQTPATRNYWPGTILPNETVGESEADVECKICHANCTTNTRLQIHLALLHDKVDYFESDIYRCLICQATLKKNTSIWDVKKHLKHHIKEKRFVCHYCFDGFDIPEELSVHLSEDHVRCNVCMKVVSNYKDLKMHLFSHDTMDRFECDTCKKTFLNDQTLKDHVKWHVNEDLTKCSTCKRSAFFRTPNRLKKHFYMKHIHRPVERHQCDKCEKRFISDGYLKLHCMNKH